MEEPKISVELTHDEAYLLYSIVDDRIKLARNKGIEDSHPSSVFRQRLLEKLTIALTHHR